MELSIIRQSFFCNVKNSSGNTGEVSPLLIRINCIDHIVNWYSYQEVRGPSAKYVNLRCERTTVAYSCVISCRILAQRVILQEPVLVCKLDLRSH